MTILHVLDHSVPLVSGYSFRTRSIVRFEARAGLRPVLLTSPRQGSARNGAESLEGLLHYRTGETGGRLPVIREVRHMVRMARRVAEVVRAERPRLLHAHSPLLNGFPALWVGRRCRLPVVYEIRAFWEDAAVDHGSIREGSARYRVSRALETMLCQRVDRVVTICEGMRQDLIRRGVAGGRIVVVPNGVDVDAFRPRPRSEGLAKQMGLNGSLVLGFVGSFYRYEGLRFLVESMPALREAAPGAKLLLVGSGEEESALRAVAAGLRDAVIFAGRVPHRGVDEFYALIDVVACPRRRMRLTELVTPLKPLEAMAMAKPVVASDVGGHQELIRNGTTGLLFAAENREALVAQAARLARDPGLRHTLGTAAREYVCQERAWDRLVLHYTRLYEELT